MEAESSDTRQRRDQELNEGLEAYAAEELDGLSIQNQRLARVQEYEEAAVSRPDPFAAVIGMGNADLQRIFDHLSTAILDVMDSRKHSVDELREFSPDIRLLLKLRKSIETDLAVQTPDVEQPAASFAANMTAKGITNEAIRKHGLVPKHWFKND
jgi:hypothetical protein